MLFRGYRIFIGISNILMMTSLILNSSVRGFQVSRQNLNLFRTNVFIGIRSSSSHVPVGGVIGGSLGWKLAVSTSVRAASKSGNNNNNRKKNQRRRKSCSNQKRGHPSNRKQKSLKSPEGKRNLRNVEDSSTQKMGAWSFGVPMAERSMTKVTVDTQDLVPNSRNYEKARPRFSSLRKYPWEKRKHADATHFPNPTGRYLTGLSQHSENIKTMREKPMKPKFKFTDGNMKNKLGTSIEPVFQPPDANMTYADNFTSYCSKEEYLDYYEVLSEIFIKGDLKGKGADKKGKASLEDKQFMSKWLYRSEPLVQTNLSMLHNEGGKLSRGEGQKANASAFHEELSQQKQLFMEKSGLNSIHYSYLEYIFIIFGNYCSKFNKPDALRVAWYKAKEAGISMSEKMCNSYLYVLTNNPSMLSGTVPEAGSILSDLLKGNETSVGNTKEDIPCEVATYHDLLYKPTDRSTKLRVSSLVAIGDAAAAEELLNDFASGPSGDSVKLRTYLPILKSYCDSNLCDKAFCLFSRMQRSPQAHLEPENYVLLLSTLAQNGYFRDDNKAPHLTNAKGLGYNYNSGPMLFDEFVKHMAEDVLEISATSAKRLYNSFVESSKDLMHEEAKVLPTMALLESNVSRAMDNELIAGRTIIDSSTARCPRSNATLRLLKLNKIQRERLHEGLIDVSADAYHEFNKKRNVTREESKIACEKLREFSNWMNEREQKPFTAVVDGANVAYFGQNFHEGRFNYHQIEFLVKALESIHEHALVVLPSKYTQDSFHVNLGGWRKQKMDKKERAVLKRLEKNGQLYVTPAGFLDDYYWMLASISDQKNSSNSTSFAVSAEQAAKEGRFPGARPMVLSNDLMRDHRLELFDPRLFRRWTASHIVNYDFTAFVNDECIDADIGFSTPDFFSKEIQGNPTENGTAWHFPVTEWTENNERLVIRLPRTNPKEYKSFYSH